MTPQRCDREAADRTPRRAAATRPACALLATIAVTVAWGLVPTTLEAQEPTAGLEVAAAVVATGIEDRQPVGAGTSFPASVGTVYFYTVFEGDFEERQVEHVWLRDGEEVARVPLTIRGPRWRTWSSKTVPVQWTGQWEARVVDTDGSVIASAAFQVGG